MGKPLVSIIVPVYNVKAYLIECLESVVAIDYDLKEVIIVDDGSTDGSAALCDVFTFSHPDVKLIHHKENKGLIQARITGLNQSSGDYIMFVDSDDYVHSSILKVMTKAIEDHQADVVSCWYYCVDNDTTVLNKRPILGVFDRNGIQRIATENLLYDSSCHMAGISVNWCEKLFKRSLLDGSIQKSIGLLFEDIVPVLDIIVHRCTKLVCLDDALYFYRQHPMQTTRKGLYALRYDYLQAWEGIDSLGCNCWSEQFTRRIFAHLTPYRYDNYKSFGGVFRNNKFILTFRLFRNATITKKYLWNNPAIPDEIKMHPHYFLLKYKLYWLDYFLWFSVWFYHKHVKRNSDD